MYEFFANVRDKYNPTEYVSADEMMVRFTGRSRIIFNQQPKPTPDGFKIIAFADASNGLTFDAEIDMKDGKSKSLCIMTMIKRLRYSFHTIVFDRGYSTLSLFDDI